MIRVAFYSFLHVLKYITMFHGLSAHLRRSILISSVSESMGSNSQVEVSEQIGQSANE